MVDAAALWLQSIESQLDSVSWEQFCVMVHERFDRDQHELLVRQLLHIRQTSSVSDYIARFTSLTDQLIAYNKGVDPVYFVIRFIDGLRSELRAVLLVQRPQTLDTACTLALLQEEAGGTTEMTRSSAAQISKITRTALPLPPPPKAVKQGAALESVSSTLDSKLTAVKAYRKAMGLCYKCGVKWSRDHKCAPEVLHAIQDLWETLHVDDCSISLEESSSSSEHLFLSLSKCAVTGTPAPRTIQFRGTLEGIPLTILIDSGSSSSFVSDSIVMQLSSQAVVSSPTSVHVAGGGILISNEILHDVTWCIDNHCF